TSQHVELEALLPSVAPFPDDLCQPGTSSDSPLQSDDAQTTTTYSQSSQSSIPEKEKSLQGLDNVTADGTQAFDDMVKIVDTLMENDAEDYPTIKKAYVRFSDNAGCYHNGPLLLSLPYIAKRTGILPMRYDFSDPQAGKDICDCKIAPMKAHMRRYVNEKHDIKTAQDMKQALESHGGIKGCRAAIAKVNPSRDNGRNNRIPGISLLNNFSFEENGIRAWRSYNIGTGRLFKYEELQVRPQQETGLEVLQQFGPRTRELGTIAGNAQDPSSKNDIYSCSETDCVLTFKTSSEAEAHMDI
ncbi:hypothetical protein QZH41_010326, partial [Actinostola sp. cb2023]